ncbi:hypothetical protein [Methyloceanibacter caenitepidi]|uniref:hypothetical protein n=1 Tax=Methyloceanibacter caenitepidi TaxID=1384459 RepID=UPI0005ED8A95|nr:hypothetical protein [Methyloceanibacter caenitepidi]
MATATTLVIVGNGPSLRGFDFERLAQADCIGMNAAYRFWRETGWYPRYYICLDLVVGLSHKEAIADLIRESRSNGIERFFLRQNLIEALPADVQTAPGVVNYDAWAKQEPFLSINPLTTGSHSALIGALLGYDQLILLGIDCGYVEQVSGSKLSGRTLEIAAEPGRNPNYFFDGYQQVGDKYNVPNPQPDLHIRSWRAVAPILERAGVAVWNCNPLSHVDAFPFRQLDDFEDTLGQRLPPWDGHADSLRATGRNGTAATSPPTQSSLARRAARTLWARRRWVAAALAIALVVLPFALTAAFSAPAWLLVAANSVIVLVLLAGLAAELRSPDALARPEAGNGRDPGAVSNMRATAAFSKASVVAQELKSLEERLDTREDRDHSEYRLETTGKPSD